MPEPSAWWPPKRATGKLPQLLVGAGAFLSLTTVGMTALVILQRLALPRFAGPDDKIPNELSRWIAIPSLMMSATLVVGFPVFLLAVLRTER
jgi:hypothetical protein